MVKRYHRAPRLGTRVTFKPETLFDISYYRGKRLQPGTCGKVSLIHGARGKGVYCDPMNRLVAVRWDSGRMLCVPPKTLVRGCEGGLGCDCGLGTTRTKRRLRRRPTAASRKPKGGWKARSARFERRKVHERLMRETLRKAERD